MSDNAYVDAAAVGFNKALKLFKAETDPTLALAVKKSRFDKDRIRRKKKKRALKANKRSFLKFSPQNRELVYAILELDKGKAPWNRKGRKIFVKGRKDETGSEGALIIVRFSSNPPEYAIVEDLEKPKPGFTYGGMKKDNGGPDQDIHSTAERECREEIFCGIRVSFAVTPGDLFNRILSRGHTVHLFAINLPDDTPLARGEEQKRVYRLPAWRIEELIRGGNFLTMHTAAWEKYKKSPQFLRA